MTFEMQEKDFFLSENHYSRNENIKSSLLYGNRKDKCDISIMIPTYRRKKYLLEAIESVLRQHTQYDYEVVIIDNDADASDTFILETLQKINSDRIAYYKNDKNIGMFANWNRCIELARAPWLLILNDDDTLEPDYIEHMMRVASNREHGLIACSCNVIDAASVKQKRTKKNRLFSKLLRNGGVMELFVKDFFFARAINIYGTLLNRADAIELGGFDPDINGDVFFMINMISHFGGCLLNMHLMNYRFAVNESLNVGTQIAFIWCDCFQKKLVNEKLKIMSKKSARNFIASSFYTHCNALEKKGNPLFFDVPETEIKQILEKIKLDFDIPERRWDQCIYHTLEVSYWLWRRLIGFRKLQETS